MKKMSFLFMVLSINLLILQGCKQNAENSDGTISANGETDDDADFDPSEVFIGSVDMSMSSNKEGESKDLPTMTYYSNGEKLAIKMQMGAEVGKQMNMIFDPNQKTITMLDATSMQAMVTKIPDMTDFMDKDSAIDVDVKIDKTGETKDIEGFKCRKYIVTSKDGVYEFWITKEIKGSLAGLMSSMNGGDKGKDPFGYQMKKMKGFVLEAKLKNTGESEEITMKFSNIKQGQPDAKLFSTDGYKVQDMSQMMEEMKKKIGK